MLSVINDQSGSSLTDVGSESKTETLLALYSTINNLPFATVAPPSSPPCHLAPSPGSATSTFDLSSAEVV